MGYNSAILLYNADKLLFPGTVRIENVSIMLLQASVFITAVYLHVIRQKLFSVLTRLASWSGSAKWTQTDTGVRAGVDTKTSVVTVDSVTDVFATVVFTCTRPTTSSRKTNKT